MNKITYTNETDLTKKARHIHSLGKTKSVTDARRLIRAGAVSMEIEVYAGKKTEDKDYYYVPIKGKTCYRIGNHRFAEEKS